jgi:hypothetical protein
MCQKVPIKKIFHGVMTFKKVGILLVISIQPCLFQIFGPYNTFGIHTELECTHNIILFTICKDMLKKEWYMGEGFERCCGWWWLRKFGEGVGKRQ